MDAAWRDALRHRPSSRRNMARIVLYSGLNPYRGAEIQPMPDVKPPSARSFVRAAATVVLLNWALLGSSMVASAQGSAARPPAEEGLTPRPATTRMPTGAACADCGTVWSIERRERPRWSSVVGTAGAQGAMPQLLRPRPATRASDGADSERASGAETGGRSVEAPGASSASGPSGEGERDAAAEAGFDPAASRLPTGPAPLPERERSRVLRDPDGPAPRRGWQVTVRMDDGTMQTAYSDILPTLRVGDRVRMGGGPGAFGARTAPR